MEEETLRNFICILIVGIVAAGLAVAGCGGGGDDGSSSGGEGSTNAGSETSSESQTTHGPIAKAVFVKRGNEICKEARIGMRAAVARLQKETAELGPGGSEGAELEFIEEALVPALQAEATQLRALGLPRGDEKHGERIVKSIEEALETAEDESSEALETSANLSKIETLAIPYGMPECPAG